MKSPATPPTTTPLNPSWKSGLLGAALMAFASLAPAAILAGRFSDPANTALVGSDLGSPGFADANTIANNVALYGLTLHAKGQITIQSTGFAAGGADPYFSLFRGLGGGAQFIASNYAQAFSTGGDFVYAALLDAGDYQIALGTFANLSFAENLGTGLLGDGFIGLGVPGSLGDSSYRLVVTLPGQPNPAPEPGAIWLVAIGLAAAGTATRVRVAKGAAQS